MVTEFLPLGSLASAMEKHKFSYVLRLKCLLDCSKGYFFVFVQVTATGMDLLHKSSLLHRSHYEFNNANILEI